MSDNVHGGFYAWATDGLAGFWQLDYMPATLNSKNIRPDTIKIDWAFVIGYVLSLIAILFTFDSISGERERGYTAFDVGKLGPAPYRADW